MTEQQGLRDERAYREEAAQPSPSGHSRRRSGTAGRKAHILSTRSRRSRPIAGSRGRRNGVLLRAVFAVWTRTTIEATYFDITGRDTQIGPSRRNALGLLMNAAISAATVIAVERGIRPSSATAVSWRAARRPFADAHVEHRWVHLRECLTMRAVHLFVEPRALAQDSWDDPFLRALSCLQAAEVGP